MLVLSGFENCEDNCYNREYNKYKPKWRKILIKTTSKASVNAGK